MPFGAIDENDTADYRDFRRRVWTHCYLQREHKKNNRAAWRALEEMLRAGGYSHDRYPELLATHINPILMSIATDNFMPDLQKLPSPGNLISVGVLDATLFDQGDDGRRKLWEAITQILVLRTRTSFKSSFYEKLKLNGSWWFERITDTVKSKNSEAEQLGRDPIDLDTYAVSEFNRSFHISLYHKLRNSKGYYRCFVVRGDDSQKDPEMVKDMNLFWIYLFYEIFIACLYQIMRTMEKSTEVVNEFFGENSSFAQEQSLAQSLHSALKNTRAGEPSPRSIANLGGFTKQDPGAEQDLRAWLDGASSTSGRKNQGATSSHDHLLMAKIVISVDSVMRELLASQEEHAKLVWVAIYLKRYYLTHGTLEPASGNNQQALLDAIESSHFEKDHEFYRAARLFGAYSKNTLAEIARGPFFLGENGRQRQLAAHYQYGKDFFELVYRLTNRDPQVLSTPSQKLRIIDSFLLLALRSREDRHRRPDRLNRIRADIADKIYMGCASFGVPVFCEVTERHPHSLRDTGKVARPQEHAISAPIIQRDTSTGAVA